MRVVYRLLAAVIITGSVSAHARSQSKATGDVQAEALPVTRTDGGLKLTFTKLEVVPPRPGPPADAPDEASWTRVNFLYDWKGRALNEWSTHRITALHAAGRTYSPKRTSTQLFQGGRQRQLFGTCVAYHPTLESADRAGAHLADPEL